MQYDSDISAYTVEKTMDMENKIRMMRHVHAARSRPSIQVSATTVNLLAA